MKNKTLEVLNTYANLTAGRYYGDAELARIRDLICRAEFLSDEEKVCFDECVDSDLASCVDATSCDNAHLISFMSDTNEYLTEYLFARAQKAKEAEGIWNNRLEWIRYSSAQQNTADKCLECAMINYAFGKVEVAKERFESLARLFDLQSIKYLYVICADMGDLNGAAYYLHLLNKLRTELYYESPSAAEKTAFDALPKEAKDRAESEVSHLVLDFFRPEGVGSILFFKGGFVK